MLKTIQTGFEFFLFNCRFIVLFAVIGSLAAAVSIFVQTTIQMVRTIRSVFTMSDSRLIVAVLIGSIDKYLFGTVLLIFSMGLYELFIGRIYPAHINDSRPGWLKIKNIDGLKSSLGKVITMILIVTFFEHALVLPFKDPVDLLYLGLGILLISLAQFLAHLGHRGGHRKDTGPASS